MAHGHFGLFFCKQFILDKDVGQFFRLRPVAPVDVCEVPGDKIEGNNVVVCLQCQLSGAVLQFDQFDHIPCGVFFQGALGQHCTEGLSDDIGQTLFFFQ